MASDVEIDWGGADVQTLAELPPVFDGEVMTVYGRALGTAPRSVTLRCRTTTGPKSWSVAVPSPSPSGDRVIATMWARRTIQSLEEVNGIHRSAHVGNESRERAMLVQLSKEFNLLSSLTTFVTVEHRTLEERNAGKPATRRVPVALAQGWGDVMCAVGADGPLEESPRRLLRCSLNPSAARSMVRSIFQAASQPPLPGGAVGSGS